MGVWLGRFWVGRSVGALGGAGPGSFWGCAVGSPSGSVFPPVSSLAGCSCPSAPRSLALFSLSVGGLGFRARRLPVPGGGAVSFPLPGAGRFLCAAWLARRARAWGFSVWVASVAVPGGRALSVVVARSSDPPWPWVSARLVLLGFVAFGVGRRRWRSSGLRVSR